MNAQNGCRGPLEISMNFVDGKIGKFQIHFAKEIFQ